MVSRPDAAERQVVSEVLTTSCTVSYQPPPDDGGMTVTGCVFILLECKDAKCYKNRPILD